jgi:hypothetical protein
LGPDKLELAEAQETEGLESTETRLPEVQELAVVRKIEELELAERLVEPLETEMLEKFEAQGIEELELVEVQ